MSGFTVADIPKGDNYRTGTYTTITPDVTDVTILSLTTTSGILHGIYIDYQFSSGANIVVESVKVTVDGAAERTLNGILTRDSSSNNNSFFCPLPIRFATSLVVKIRKNDVGGAATIKATAHYSVY